ncbi:MAG: hypothetical protein M3R15_07270 [Acidobacteriota bacterium]|nr:hypothetical protein [Acidobacteriota bacterium]
MTHLLSTSLRSSRDFTSLSFAFNKRNFIIRQLVKLINERINLTVKRVTLVGEKGLVTVGARELMLMVRMFAYAAVSWRV